MAATSPASGAETLTLRGGALVALGPGRYVNRAIGVGTDRFDTAELTRLESFFERHGVPASVELSSWVSTAMLSQLNGRGYEPYWSRNVYAWAAEAAEQTSRRVTVQAVDDSLFEIWRSVFAAAFEAPDGVSRRISDEHAAAAYATSGSRHFLAHIDGQPAGCGSVQFDGTVAWLGGAATIPSFRRRGVQSALIHHRLALAIDAGCELVVASALPSGMSARNLEAHGFEFADTQLVMTKSVTAPPAL